MSKTSIHGRRLRIDDTGNLEANEIDITQPCADATVTVSDEDTNVVTITVQLLDANGSDIAYVETVDVFFYDDATRTTASTASPSTGLEDGTDGAIVSTVEAHKHYLVTSEDDGDIDMTWTDTGADVVYVGVRLPGGRIVMGDQAITTTT